MGIDETSPCAGEDDTLLSPVLRPDVVEGLENRLQRRAVHAVLFGDGTQAASVGRFRLLDRIGHGAMGRVYAAYDEQLDRKIAIKLIRRRSSDSSEALERALREARALARVSHPHVVHVYEVGEIDGQLFVAMEFLAGPTLRAWLDQHPDRDWRAVLEIMRQAGEGLAAVHAEGIVHRDFKPHNLMFGGDGRIRVLDFGLARLARGEAEALQRAALESAACVDRSLDSLTMSGALLGTPAYMAPEQLAGRPADVRSDVFGFCVTLFEALYDKRPFAGQTLEQLRDAALHGRIERPLPNIGVPTWLHPIVLRGLSPDPAQRFASMRALLDALADAAPLRRRKRWAATALVGMLGLLGIGGWVLTQQLDRAGSDAAPPAELEALRSAELLAQGNSVDALALAIEAASRSSSPKVQRALFEASAAELSWGAVAQFPGFPDTLSFSADNTRLAIAHKQPMFGQDVHTIDVHDLAGGGPTLALRTHGCHVADLQFAANHARLMAMCVDRADLHVWDTNTGAAIASFAGERSPVFSSSGLLVATTTGDEVELTSVADEPRLVATLDHERAATMIEFSTDGARIATGGPAQDTRVWNTSSGALVATLPGSSALRSRFFAGADRVATVGVDRQVRIWAIESGELLGVLSTPPTEPVELRELHELAISPDASRVALYVDRDIWVWDASTGELVVELHDQAENPLRNDNPWVLGVSGPPMSFSPDGSRLVTRRHDGGVHLLDSSSGTSLARSDLALSYSFAPDHPSLAVGTGSTVEIWDAASGERIRSLPSPIPHVTEFSPDGSLLAACHEDDDGRSVRLWQTKPHPATITRIASRIGKYPGVAVSPDQARIITADDVVARAWDARTGAELAVFEGHAGPITAMSISTRLATASVDGTVLLWDPGSAQLHGQLLGHRGAVRVLGFADDGAVLGSGSDDQTVRQWDVASATSIGVPLEHPGPVSALKFTGDGGRVVTASGRIAYIWEIGSQAIVAELGHEGEVRSIALRNARMATHDGERVRLWDSTTGELIHELTDPGKIPTVEFSPDGERLSSAGGVWEVASGRLLVELEDDDVERHGRKPACSSIQFAPDGGFVALAGRVWSAHTGALVGNFTTGHEQGVCATEFLQAGSRLLTVSRDAVVIRDTTPPLVAACERLRPFAIVHADLAPICDP